MIIVKVDLSSKGITKLDEIYHSESNLYVKSDTIYKIFKYGVLTSDMLDTIMDLCEIKHDSLAETLYPVTLNNRKIDGIAMRYYKDYMTLSKYIETSNMSLNERIKLIKKLDEIFKSFKNINYTYFDIHTDNILINNDDIKIVDTTSGVFNDNNEKDRITMLNRMAYLYYLLLLDTSYISNQNTSVQKRLLGRLNDKQRRFLFHAMEIDYSDFDPLECTELFDEETISDQKKILRIE